MAKSARASSRKANNQVLKKKVFGPVESERAERLSAKLLELASQAKPQKEEADVDVKTDDEMDADAAEKPAAKTSEAPEEHDMDLDTTNPAKKPSTSGGRSATGKIQKTKKRTSRIVFPRYKDRKGKKV